VNLNRAHSGEQHQRSILSRCQTDRVGHITHWYSFQNVLSLSAVICVSGTSFIVPCYGCSFLFEGLPRNRTLSPRFPTTNLTSSLTTALAIAHINYRQESIVSFDRYSSSIHQLQSLSQLTIACISIPHAHIYSRKSQDSMSTLIAPWSRYTDLFEMINGTDMSDLLSERSRRFYDGTYKWNSDGFIDDEGGKSWFIDIIASIIILCSAPQVQ
jgi:hypothetical protein